MSDKKIVIVAFDIETRGPSPSKNGINAIGYCIGDAYNMKVIQKERLHVEKLDKNQCYDPHTLETFWSKHQDLKTLYETDTISAETAIKHIRNLIDELQKSYEIYIVSDNPTFDAKFLDYYLDYFGYKQLQYDSNDPSIYRLVHDSDSYARGKVSALPNDQWCDNKQVADKLSFTWTGPIGTNHMPEDDAESIFKFHFLCIHSTKCNI